MIDVMVMKAATDDEVRSIRDLLTDELEIRKARNIQAVKRTLKVGDKFISHGLSPAKHNGKVVTIREVKKTRVSVIFEGDDHPCTIPISCLKSMEAA